MKYYVNYYQILGSDSVLPLDGRWGLQRAKDAAIERMISLNKCLGKKVTVFNIIKNGKVVLRYDAYAIQ